MFSISTAMHNIVDTTFDLTTVVVVAAAAVAVAAVVVVAVV